MFSDPIGSVFASLSGIITALAYRTDLARLKRFRFPRFISNVFSKLILPLLGTTPERRNRRPYVVGGRSTSTTSSQSSTTSTTNSRQTTPVSPQTQQLTPQQQQQLLQHLFSPLQQQQQAPQAPNEQTIQTLTSMGFSRESVIQALRRANNDVTVATNILLDSS